MRRRVPGISYIPLIGGLFQKISKEKQKVDFVIFLTPQIIESPEEMRGATVRASGFTSRFISGDLNMDITTLMPPNTRPELLSVDISPVEADVDARFRELYQRSLKRK